MQTWVPEMNCPWCVQGEGGTGRLTLENRFEVRQKRDRKFLRLFRRFRLILKVPVHVFNASVEGTSENILHENGT